jgi:hypothetical protein
MPWIRLSDNYVDHPKFLALSAFAFRLWHEGMAFARRHQTDGIIAAVELKGFRYFRPVHVAELTTPYREGASPLWETIEGVGYKIHDYLDWNPSREEENERRAESKERMRVARERRRTRGVAPSVAPPVALQHPANVQRTNIVRAHDVLDRDRDKYLGKEKENDEIDRRAARLCHRYLELFMECRKGAKTRLLGNSLEFDAAVELVQLWDDARLEKLAKIVLTTDDPWISGTDRSFSIFAKKASWADDRLRQAESGAA